MENKFPSTCFNCQKKVPTGKGHRVNFSTNATWRTECDTCNKKRKAKLTKLSKLLNQR